MDSETSLTSHLAPTQETLRRRVTIADLGAIVHVDELPAAALAELPALYSSPFSIAEYFAIYDHPRRLYGCELDEPRHVIAFTSRGATADVLNKSFAMGPAETARVARAIFRARPEIRRIRTELSYPPRELDLPLRELHRSDEQVLELPESEEAYERLLGASTRKRVRGYRNRLARKYPDFELRTIEREEISLALVEQIYDWNQQRIRIKGQQWGFRDQRTVSHRLWRLLQSHGLALCGYIGGDCVAGMLSMYVGGECWARTAGFDPVYMDVDLGQLMMFFFIRDCISRGCAHAHLGWGTTTYKQRLGAAPVTTYRASLYRSRLDKALYARELWWLVNDTYWRLHGEAKRQMAALASWRARQDSNLRPSD